MRRAIPWFDLAIGVLVPGAGLVLLAIGAGEQGPLSFIGWRSLVLAVPGVLLARPSAVAWRDAIPGAAVAVFALGMLGHALVAGDVATVAVVTVSVALGVAPLVTAAACPRWPTVTETLGAALAVAAIALLGSTGSLPAGVWLAAASGLGFATMAVLSERVIHDHPAPSIVMPQVLVAGVVLVAAGGLLDDVWLPSDGVWVLLAVTGLATGLAPMLARWRAVEVLGAPMVRRALPFEMVAAVLVAMWAGGPTPTTALWAAMGLGIAGAFAASWEPDGLTETEAFSAGR